MKKNQHTRRKKRAEEMAEGAKMQAVAEEDEECPLFMGAMPSRAAFDGNVGIQALCNLAGGGDEVGLCSSSSDDECEFDGGVASAQQSAAAASAVTSGATAVAATAGAGRYSSAGAGSSNSNCLGRTGMRTAQKTAKAGKNTHRARARAAASPYGAGSGRRGGCGGEAAMLARRGEASAVARAERKKRRLAAHASGEAQVYMSFLGCADLT